MQIYVGVKEKAASLRPTCRCHEYPILVSLLLHIWCSISTACCMKISGWGLVADIRSREKGRDSPFSTKHKRWPTNLAKHRKRLLHVKEAIKVYKQSSQWAWLYQLQIHTWGGGESSNFCGGIFLVIHITMLEPSKSYVLAITTELYIYIVYLS